MYNAAFFPWASYFGQNSIDLDDQRENSGDLAIVNMIEGKLKNMGKSIRKKMGNQIYTARAVNVDNTGKAVGFTGLDDVFNTNTAVEYGEIAEADVPTWKANVITSALDMGFKTLQQISAAAQVDDDNDGRPDLFITTQTLKDAYENSLQNKAEYTNHRLAEAGFENVMFRQRAPVVADNKCGANKVYALNLAFLDVETHKDYNFTKPVWIPRQDQPDTKVAYIKWGGNLVNRHRGAHALANNVSVAA